MKAFLVLVDGFCFHYLNALFFDFTEIRQFFNKPRIVFHGLLKKVGNVTFHASLMMSEIDSAQTDESFDRKLPSIENYHKLRKSSQMAA